LLISESEAVGFDYCKLRVVVAIAAATAKPVAAGADRGHNSHFSTTSRSYSGSALN